MRRLLSILVLTLVLAQSANAAPPPDSEISCIADVLRRSEQVEEVSTSFPEKLQYSDRISGSVLASVLKNMRVLNSNILGMGKTIPFT